MAAPDLTVRSLAVAMRLHGDINRDPAEPLRSVLAGLHAATSAILAGQPLDSSMPAAVANEVIVRLSAYLYAAPPGVPGAGFAHSWRNSGCATLVEPWRNRKFELLGDGDGAATGGGNPVTSFKRVGEEIVITLLSGLEFSATLPSGGVAQDVTARDDAAAALAAAQAAAVIADTALAAANAAAEAANSAGTQASAAVEAVAANTIVASHALAAANSAGTQASAAVEAAAENTTAIEALPTPGPDPESWAEAENTDLIPADKLPGPSGATVDNIVDGRLPGVPVQMRLGWSQSRAFVAGTFTRANTHPIDGATEGFTSGLIVPPFPPSLASDPTLYLGIWLAGDPLILSVQRPDRGSLLDGLDAFPAADRQALTVDQVAGYYYPAAARQGPILHALSVTLGDGPVILTDGVIEDWAKTGDASLIPVAKLPGPAGWLALVNERWATFVVTGAAAGFWEISPAGVAAGLTPHIGSIGTNAMEGGIRFPLVPPSGYEPEMYLEGHDTLALAIPGARELGAVSGAMIGWREQTLTVHWTVRTIIGRGTAVYPVQFGVENTATTEYWPAGMRLFTGGLTRDRINIYGRTLGRVTELS